MMALKPTLQRPAHRPSPSSPSVAPSTIATTVAMAARSSAVATSAASPSAPAAAAASAAASAMSGAAAEASSSLLRCSAAASCSSSSSSSSSSRFHHLAQHSFLPSPAGLISPADPALNPALVGKTRLSYRGGGGGGGGGPYAAAAPRRASSSSSSPVAARAAVAAQDGLSPATAAFFAAHDDSDPPPPAVTKSDADFAAMGVEFVEGREGVRVAELNDLFERVGFPRRDPARLQLALEHTHALVWVRATRQSRVAKLGQLLGFARATSDAALSATIWDVAVLPAWQRSGLGRAVVERLTRSLVAGGVSSIALYAEPKVVGMYRKLGFVEADTTEFRGLAFQRRRPQQGQQGARR